MTIGIPSLRVLLFQVGEEVVLGWEKEHAGGEWNEMDEDARRKRVTSENMCPASIEPCEDCERCVSDVPTSPPIHRSPSDPLFVSAEQTKTLRAKSDCTMIVYLIFTMTGQAGLHVTNRSTAWIGAMSKHVNSGAQRSIVPSRPARWRRHRRAERCRGAVDESAVGDQEGHCTSEPQRPPYVLAAL